MTITATATDDRAMYYIGIFRGSLELVPSQYAAPGQRELEISCTEEATLPNLSLAIIADDLGDPPPVRHDIVIPVAGTGTVPEVTVTAEWVNVEEVIPERYRLIKGDGQIVRITATASDPDGIQNLTKTG